MSASKAIERPTVSAVITSLDGSRGGNVERLLKQLSEQTYSEFEVVLVTGASPRTRAHNIGVRNASGEIIVFFDDDVALGEPNLIANLVQILGRPGIGIVGASVLVPPDSTPFQRRCAEQLLRITFDIVDKMVEGGATHAALAIAKADYDAFGGEVDTMQMNDDVYLRKSIADMGQKIVLAPHAWVYHPLPDSWGRLIKKRFADGLAIAGDYKLHPEHIYYSPIESHEELESSGLLRQMARNLSVLTRAITGLKIISLSERLSLAVGYALGALRSKNYHHRSLERLSSDGKIRRWRKRGSMLELIEDQESVGEIRA
ncbi:MAG: glycosyltransferase [Actinomycetota bacterium]|nr:glycosyltransferase [Actinomycetota bacterium]